MKIRSRIKFKKILLRVTNQNSILEPQIIKRSCLMIIKMNKPVWK